MEEQEQIEVYNLIKKIITNPNRKHFGLVEQVKRLSYLNFEDIHQELFCKFLEENKDRKIDYIPTYLDKFCFMRLMDMKKYYEKERRAEQKWSKVEYDDEELYTNTDTEENICEIIDKKYDKNRL